MGAAALPLAMGGSALLKGGMSLYAQRQASRAAEAQAKSQQEFLDRKAADTRNAMKENSTRMREDKNRSMAEVRVQQAMAGFANSGTPLAVFGEIGNRYDDRINEITDRSLNQLADMSAQRKMVGFADDQRQKSNRLSMIGTGISSLAGAGFGYHQGYRESGGDPFSIFDTNKAIIVPEY